MMVPILLHHCPAGWLQRGVSHPKLVAGVILKRYSSMLLQVPQADALCQQTRVHVLI